MADVYKVSNWSEYDKNLKSRGCIQMFISHEAIEQWFYKGPRKKGGVQLYSDISIQTCLTISYLFKLPLRQTAGYMESIMPALGLKGGLIPDHTTLSRRSKTLEINDDRKDKSSLENVSVAIDSSGVSIYNASPHDKTKDSNRQYKGPDQYKKLHIIVDLNTKKIIASQLTDSSTQDCKGAEDMLTDLKNQEVTVDAVYADGAYDKFVVYKAMHESNIQNVFIPPIVTAATQEERIIKRRKKEAKNAEISEEELKAEIDEEIKEEYVIRDEIIKQCKLYNMDTMKENINLWKKESGYHKRSGVENAFYRFKKAFSHYLRSKNWLSRLTEINIKIFIFNKIIDIPNGCISYKVT